jgi:hypothetical protein
MALEETKAVLPSMKQKITDGLAKLEAQLVGSTFTDGLYKGGLTREYRKRMGKALLRRRTSRRRRR